MSTNRRLFELCKQEDLEGLKAIIDNDPKIDVMSSYISQNSH